MAKCFVLKQSRGKAPVLFGTVLQVLDCNGLELIGALQEVATGENVISFERLPIIGQRIVTYSVQRWNTVSFASVVQDVCVESHHDLRKLERQFKTDREYTDDCGVSIVSFCSP